MPDLDTQHADLFARVTAVLADLREVVEARKPEIRAGTRQVPGSPEPAPDGGEEEE